MKPYLRLTATLIAAFLGLFLLAEGLGLDVLTEDPRPLFEGLGGPATALLGVGLLIIDVFLPVPSSVVMVLLGGSFGVLWGTLLAWGGSVLAALFAFALGRRGGPWLHRAVSPQQRAQADALLARWGPTAIALTRPVPMLAEAVALIAGTSPLRWGQLFAAAGLGCLPPALVYALTGALGASMASGLWAFGGVLLVTALFFWLAHRAARAQPTADAAPRAEDF